MNKKMILLYYNLAYCYIWLFSIIQWEMKKRKIISSIFFSFDTIFLFVWKKKKKKKKK